MQLEVLTALRRGFDRLLTRSGLMLVGAMFVLDLVFISIPAALVSPTVTPNAFMMGVLGIAGGILALAVVAVAVRVFLQNETRTIPRELIRDRIGVATMNLVLGQIAATVIIGIGFFLIIPGIYLLVSLVFWYIFVAAEDEDFIDAFRQSWVLTRGHKWRVLALIIGIGAVFVAFQLVVGLFALLLPGIFFPSVLAGVVAAFSTIWGVAVTTDAYTQLQK